MIKLQYTQGHTCSKLLGTKLSFVKTCQKGLAPNSEEWVIVKSDIRKLGVQSNFILSFILKGRGPKSSTYGGGVGVGSRPAGLYLWISQCKSAIISNTMLNPISVTDYRLISATLAHMDMIRIRGWKLMSE